MVSKLLACDEYCRGREGQPAAPQGMQNEYLQRQDKEHLEQLLPHALDMHREQRAPKRRQTVKTLHGARSKPDSLH